MKKLLSAVLVFALLISGTPVYARDMIKSMDRLPGTITELEGYLFERVEDDKQLMNLRNIFYDIGGKNGIALGTYCEVLLYLADGRYSLAISYATVLADNEGFKKYLDTLESNYIVDGATLLLYARAREAESDRDYEAAIELYASSLSFFDAWDRYIKLLDTVCKRKYETGEKALESGNYALAIECFTYTSKFDYLISKDLLKYAKAEAAKAAPTPTKRPTPTPTKRPTPTPTKKPTPTPEAAYIKFRANMPQQQKLQACVAAGGSHTIALKTSGSVVATGLNSSGQCNVGSWRGIVAVSAGKEHSVGLKSDGTVVATGGNSDKQCNVSSWQNIVAVAAGGYHTVGLKADGTVVAVGNNKYKQCEVSSWRNIIAVAAGSHHTVGLKSDGTMVAIGYNGSKQSNVDICRDMIAISAGDMHTISVDSDGAVTAIGYNYSNQCNVSDWYGIIAVAGGLSHTVGLKSDGKVIAIGYNVVRQCNVGSWRDIIAIAAGESHTVGLKRDGTVVATGHKARGQCDVGEWRGIGVAD